jgi:hypothetical protein
LWEEFDSGKGNVANSKASGGKQLGERQPATISAMSNGNYTSFLSWLPHFYDEVLLELEKEWKWCIRPGLILSILICARLDNLGGHIPRVSIPFRQILGGFF